MRDTALTRRQLLAAGLGAGAAAALGSLGAAARTAAVPVGSVQTFYDRRFARSRLLAAALPQAARPTPVQGDVTALLGLVGPARRLAGPMVLQGVTTEIVPFCLEQYARTHHEVRLESRRLDRDLFAWSLTIHARSPAA